MRPLTERESWSTGTVHFGTVADKFGWIECVACGQIRWQEADLDPTHVTCKTCRRTRAYRDAVGEEKGKQ